MLVNFARRSAARAVSRATMPALRRGMAPRICATGCSCCRSFSSVSPAMQKLSKGFESELQYEKENYDTPEVIREVPAGWKLEEKPGEVNMKIAKDLPDNKSVKIEWQLVTPFDPTMMEDPEAAGGKDEEMPDPGEEVDFTITVESKSDGGSTGTIFFCNTQQGESHRFTIGNVKSWTSVEERDSAGAYNGPEFEDLEDQLQEAMDEYLGELGIDDKIFDYIETSATDKEHREYVRWLDNMKKIMSGATA